MSYDKQTWQTGDVITANKLNHIEDGIAGAGGGGVLVVSYTVDGGTATLNHTWQEIYDAPLAVMLFDMGNEKPVGVAIEFKIVEGDSYTVDFAPFTDLSTVMSFSSASADDYPTAHN